MDEVHSEERRFTPEGIEIDIGRMGAISIPTGVNLRSSEWTSSILRHYDFGLEAISFV